MHPEDRLRALAAAGDDDAICHLYLLLKRQNRLTDQDLAPLARATHDDALRLALGPATESHFMDLCALVRRSDPPERLQRLDTCLDHWPTRLRVPSPGFWDWLREPHKPRNHPAWSLIRHLELLPHMLPWLDSEPVLFPISSVRLDGYGHHIQAVLEPFRSVPLPALSRIAHLDLSGTYCDPKLLQALMRAPHLSGLRTLRMVSCSVNAQTLQMLCDYEHLGGLRRLDLSANRLTSSPSAAGTWVVERERLVHLPAPAPVAPQVYGQVCEALAKLTRLEHLTLSHCNLDDATAVTLAESDLLSHLQWLDLGYNAFTPLGIRALSGSPYLHPALHLDLSNAGLSDPSMLRAFHAAGVELIY